VSDLRAFRRNAVHVRTGLAGLNNKDAQPGRVAVEGGQIRDQNQMERFKRLAIPVRRALKDSDRVSFAVALAALPADAGAAVRKDWAAFQNDLNSTVNLGGSKLPRREVLAAFLDAAAFYNQLEHDRARSNDLLDEYDAFIQKWGPAAENLGSELAEDAARVIVALDDEAADALGEPKILPPPEKTPPPPPDPKEPLWKRIWMLVKPDSNG